MGEFRVTEETVSLSTSSYTARNIKGQPKNEFGSTGSTVVVSV